MKKIKLDKEEKDVLESFERGEWQSVKNKKRNRKRHTAYFASENLLICTLLHCWQVFVGSSGIKTPVFAPLSAHTQQWCSWARRVK